MKKNIKHRNFNEVIVEHFKEDPKFADEFLDFSLKEFKQDKDEKTLFLSLRQLAIAKGGFSELSKKTGLSRESLYKTLSANGNPKFNTIRTILESLGYGFVIKPLAKKTT
ncbi:MAG: addiction module antidote protein [Pseudomonadota bacterium]